MSRLSSCFAGVIWFLYDVIMAKEKCGLDDGCTILICSTDDGCTHWWRWLHYFGWVIFDTHTADPLQTNMPIGCMIVVNVIRVKSPALTPNSTVQQALWVILVIGIACRSLTFRKNVYFIYFLSNSKLIHGWSDTNLNCRWVQNIVNFNEW